MNYALLLWLTKGLFLFSGQLQIPLWEYKADTWHDKCESYGSKAWLGKGRLSQRCTCERQTETYRVRPYVVVVVLCAGSTFSPVNPPTFPSSYHASLITTLSLSLIFRPFSLCVLLLSYAVGLKLQPHLVCKSSLDVCGLLHLQFRYTRFEEADNEITVPDFKASYGTLAKVGVSADVSLTMHIAYSSVLSSSSSFFHMTWVTYPHLIKVSYGSMDQFCPFHFMMR